MVIATRTTAIVEFSGTVYRPIVLVTDSLKRRIKCICDKRFSPTSISTIERGQDSLNTKESDQSLYKDHTMSSSPHAVYLPLMPPFASPHCYVSYPAVLRVLPRFADHSPCSRPTGQSTDILLTSSSFCRGGHWWWEIQSECRWFTINSTRVFEPTNSREWRTTY